MAALAFDPLCGDGTGNAIREAILAAAVVRAAHRGVPVPDLLNQYQNRLMRALGRHLHICCEFYTAGAQGPRWDAELASIDRGLEFCAREECKAQPFRYRLQGFELHAV